MIARLPVSSGLVGTHAAIAAAIVIAAALASCGGGGGSAAAANPPPAPPPDPPPTVEISVSGLAVVKLQAAAPGTTLMEERLTALVQPGPDRRLDMRDARGAASGAYVPPAGLALIDFAQHPSGEISAALATATAVRLVRLDRSGHVLDELEIADPQAATDPFFDHGGLHDDHSLLPVYTRDAVRVAAINESLAVALRTGRNATVAYRYDHAPASGYARAWRSLVEPGLSVFAVGITSGSYDTFGALENQWQLRMDADAAGNLAIAVPSSPFNAPVFAAHAAYFGTPVDAHEGALVTRLAPDGSRVSTAVIDTVRPSELHGLRLTGGDIAIVGRVFTARRDDGGGWDAYVAHVPAAAGAAASYRTLDIDRGEILFDIALLPGGRQLVAGASGYTQNPDGASVSEQTAALLAVLESDGTLVARIALPFATRQNQARSVALPGGRWLVGGMEDGPGTHSGDGDPTKITANGFAREVAAVP